MFYTICTKMLFTHPCATTALNFVLQQLLNSCLERLRTLGQFNSFIQKITYLCAPYTYTHIHRINHQQSLRPKILRKSQSLYTACQQNIFHSKQDFLFAYKKMHFYASSACFDRHCQRGILVVPYHVNKRFYTTLYLV